MKLKLNQFIIALLLIGLVATVTSCATNKYGYKSQKKRGCNCPTVR